MHVLIVAIQRPCMVMLNGVFKTAQCMVVTMHHQSKRRRVLDMWAVSEFYCHSSSAYRHGDVYTVCAVNITGWIILVHYTQPASFTLITRTCYDTAQTNVLLNADCFAARLVRYRFAIILSILQCRWFENCNIISLPRCTYIFPTRYMSSSCFCCPTSNSRRARIIKITGNSTRLDHNYLIRQLLYILFCYSVSHIIHY